MRYFAGVSPFPDAAGWRPVILLAPSFPIAHNPTATDYFSACSFGSSRELFADTAAKYRVIEAAKRIQM
jgi:hypothetical protein